MRIKHLQQALREAGRVRIGYSTPGKTKGAKVPHKLDRFRLTAPDEATIEGVAAVYGGTPEPWPDGGRDRFQVVTDVDSLNVIFPIGMNAVWQCFEQYDGGYPVVRCDGERFMRPDKRGRLADEGPCACDPNDRACKMTTAVSVILRDLPGIATWRVVTHSFYAATELTAAADMIETVMAAGMSVPARLFITNRTRKALINGKPTTKHYPVLALDLAMSVAALGAGNVGNGGAPSGIPSPARRGAPPALSEGGWAPVDDGALTPAPLITVADQLAEVECTPPRRTNAPPLVPSTGRRPRTAAEAAAATPNCTVCGLPYGTAAVIPNPEPGGSRFIHATCAARLDSEPQEGDPLPDQPPAAGEPARDGGGAASGGIPPAPADPVPVTGTAQVRMMTVPQHRKAMALAAQAWPAKEMTGAEADDMRRERLLWLCAVLGQPGLTSRTQITFNTAGVLLDALEEIAEGRLGLTESGLVDAATGEVTVAAPS